MREHIARIFANWPDLAFRGRRLYVRDGLVVSEWTASATDEDGRRLEWDGIDVFPFENGLILRKDVYSAGHRPRVLVRLTLARARPRVHVTAPVPAEVERRARARLRARRRRPRARTGSLSMLTTTRRRGVPRPRGTAASRRRELRGRRQQHRPRGRRGAGRRRREHARRADARDGRAGGRPDARAPAADRRGRPVRPPPRRRGSSRSSSCSARASTGRSCSSSGPAGSGARPLAWREAFGARASFAGRGDDLHDLSRQRGRRQPPRAAHGRDAPPDRRRPRSPRCGRPAVLVNTSRGPVVDERGARRCAARRHDRRRRARRLRAGARGRAKGCSSSRTSC